MNLTALRDEIETGPLAESLAPLVSAGNDGAIAALLNADYATETSGSVNLGRLNIDHSAVLAVKTL
jgi:hypothetical protein